MFNTTENAATPNGYLYNFTLEAWFQIPDETITVIGDQFPVFQMCDGRPRFQASNPFASCLSITAWYHLDGIVFRADGLTSVGEDFVQKVGSQVTDLETYFPSRAVNYGNELWHVVLTRRVFDKSDTLNAYSGDGYATTTLYVDGVPVRTDADLGEALNSPYDDEFFSGTPIDHSWSTYPRYSRRATMGYAYGLSHTPEFGQNVTVRLVSYYNESMSAADVTQNFNAGPPSIAPVAYDGSGVGFENATNQITFPAATDGDMSLGYDTELCLKLLSVFPNNGGEFAFSSDFSDILSIGNVETTDCTAAGVQVYFRPIGGVNGWINFTYSVVDERGVESAPAGFDVYVTPDQNAPNALSSASPSPGYAGLPFYINLTGVDADPEDDLIFRVSTLPSASHGALYNGYVGCSLVSLL